MVNFIETLNSEAFNSEHEKKKKILDINLR